jgi:metal-responsive CopG/Arc/MetJ family transcriptional regulator
MTTSNIISVKTIKTQIVFPEDVLRELDLVVEERKRSEFVVEAVAEKLQRHRLEQSVAGVAGIWKDRVDLKTDAQVRQYLRRLRGGDTRRMKRLQKAWKNG